jgi:hypothetical protein
MLLKAAGAGCHVSLSDIASQPAMNKVLTKMPLCVIVRDEIVSFLSRLTNPRSSPWEQCLLDMLCTLWSNNFDQFDTTISAQADPVYVQSPAISLFGTATPAKFWSVLQGAQVSNGLFSRYLVFESHARPDAQKIPVPVTVPAALKDDLAELYRLGNDPLSLAQLNDSNIELAPQVLPWASSEAETGLLRASSRRRGAAWDATRPPMVRRRRGDRDGTGRGNGVCHARLGCPL